MNCPSICWKCVYLNSCRRFRNDPEAKVTECGTFVMRDIDKELRDAIMKNLKSSVSNTEKRPNYN